MMKRSGIVGGAEVGREKLELVPSSSGRLTSTLLLPSLIFKLTLTAFHLL